MWHEKGMRATTNDTNPISSLTAQCSPGDGLLGADLPVRGSACPCSHRSSDANKQVHTCRVSIPQRTGPRTALCQF